MPKWARWTIGVIAVILVFRDPAGAGHLVSQALHAITTLLGNVK